MYQYSFERLRVWQNAREFVRDIYLITKGFPPSERYGLASQLQRAAVSVASNIAEGSSRQSKKDQAHFMQLAYSSLIECLNQIILSQDLGYLTTGQYEVLRDKIENISNPLNAFRKSLLESLNN